MPITQKDPINTLCQILRVARFRLARFLWCSMKITQNVSYFRTTFTSKLMIFRTELLLMWFRDKDIFSLLSFFYYATAYLGNKIPRHVRHSMRASSNGLQCCIKMLSSWFGSIWIIAYISAFRSKCPLQLFQTNCTLQNYIMKGTRARAHIKSN